MQKFSNILIVDDNSVLSKNLKDILDESGYSTAIALDGQSATEQCHKKEFDLAVIDIKLPDIDGLELIAKLSKISPAMEYIIITGYASLESAVEAVRKKQIVAYESKPLDMNRILAFIQQVTERMRAKQKHKEAERKIKEYSEKLEQMVEERTKKLNQALIDTEEARNKIDGILKSVADGLIVTDLHNRILLMNHAAEDLLGVRFSEVIDRPIDFAIKEKTLREKVKYTLNKKTTGYQFDFELSGDDPKHPRIMQARTSVIHGKEGPKTGIVTIIHDVTKEREIDRMKTEFLSTAAHELRTPLTSIQGFSEILLIRASLKKEEKERYLSYIHKQAVGLTKVVNDLLDISRIESKQGFILNKEKYEADEIIKEVIPYFERQSKKHRFEVVLPDKPVEIMVDKEKIEQVLKNLLSNAVKYSPEGCVVRLICESNEEDYHISVTDRGIGMTPEQVDKIFDKFYRADTSDSAPIGTGLGMTIVKYIVEAHSGKVWVESELGKGTNVRFTIPLAYAKMKNKRSNKSVLKKERRK